MSAEGLTQEEGRIYQSMRDRGHTAKVARRAALAGVHVDDVAGVHVDDVRRIYQPKNEISDRWEPR